MPYEVEVVSPRDGVPAVRALVDALAVGESYSRAHRFDLGGANREDVLTVATGMRAVLQTAVQRCQTGGVKRFKIEAGEFVTAGKALMVCAVATRIE